MPQPKWMHCHRWFRTVTSEGHVLWLCPCGLMVDWTVLRRTWDEAHPDTWLGRPGTATLVSAEFTPRPAGRTRRPTTRLRRTAHLRHPGRG